MSKPKTKTVRLTNHMRECIRDALLEHRFGEEQKALVAQKESLAVRLYDHFFPKELQDKLDALPEGFVPEDYEIQVRMGEDTNHFEHFSFPGKQNRRYRSVDHNRWLVLDREDPLCKEYVVMANKKEDIAKARKELKSQIVAALNSVTTVGKLITLWPEVEPFCQQYIDQPPAQLPALPVKSLNNLLKLGA